MDPISYVWGISCICLGCIRKQVTLDLSVLLWGTSQGRADGPMYWQLHGTLTIRLSDTCGLGGTVLCNWLTQTEKLPWAEPTHHHSNIEAVVLALYTSQVPKRPPVRLGHMPTSATSAACFGRAFQRWCPWVEQSFPVQGPCTHISYLSQCAPPPAYCSDGIQGYTGGEFGLTLFSLICSSPSAHKLILTSEFKAPVKITLTFVFYSKSVFWSGECHH